MSPATSSPTSQPVLCTASRLVYSLPLSLRLFSFLSLLSPLSHPLNLWRMGRFCIVQGDYGRSWFTQGLIEVGKTGNKKAFSLLRGMYDWFDDPSKNPYQPYLYDGISNGEQGQIASTRMYLETPVGVWADMQVAQDIYVSH